MRLERALFLCRAVAVWRRASASPLSTPSLCLRDPTWPSRARAHRQLTRIDAASASDVSSGHQITGSLEQRTGVRHEPPRVLILRDDRAFWTARPVGPSRSRTPPNRAACYGCVKFQRANAERPLRLVSSGKDCIIQGDFPPRHRRLHLLHLAVGCGIVRMDRDTAWHGGA